MTSIIPNSGTTVGRTPITILGANFQEDAQVLIGDQLAKEVEVVSDVRITAKTPNGISGTVDVAVTNPDGLGGKLEGGFTYLIEPPIVTAVARWEVEFP